MVIRVPSLRYADEMAITHRSYRNLLRGISSDATKANYAECLKRFVKFHNISNYDKLVKFDSEQITDMMCDWVDYLSDKKLKSITIRAMLSGPELFFEMNRKIWHKKLVRKRIRKDDTIPGGTKPFTTEEIELMLDSTKSRRTKALIHFIASTGIRPAALVDPVLRMKHLEKLDDCYAVKVYDESKEGYWAFLTPEATKSMDRYLNWRQVHGEEFDPETVVFININRNMTKKEQATKQKEYVTDGSLSRIIYDLIKHAGITRTKVGNQRYDKAVVYGFRKRFNTILKLNNDVNSNITEKLMAHKRGLDGTYLQPTKEECYQEFVKAMFELTIDDSERKQVEIDKIKIEKTELQNKINEIEELKQNQDQMRKENQLDKINIQKTILDILKKQGIIEKD